MDKIFIEYIKNNYVLSKNTSLCRKHSKVGIQYIHGYEKHVSKEECCKERVYVICDKDALPDDLINKIKSDININYIISYPCIEIVIASFFQCITSTNETNKDFETIIKSGLKENKSKMNY